MLLMTSPLLMKMYYIKNEQLGNALLGQHLMLCENELPLTPFFFREAILLQVNRKDAKDILFGHFLLYDLYALDPTSLKLQG